MLQGAFTAETSHLTTCKRYTSSILSPAKARARRGALLAPACAQSSAPARGFGAKQRPAGAPKQSVPSGPKDTACPCGSGKAYEACCRPFHHGDELAPTAESLMRARYSAYVKQHAGFIVRTRLLKYFAIPVHPDNPRAAGSKTKDGQHSSTLLEDIAATFRTVEWHGLRVLGTASGVVDGEAFVKFRASFRVINQLQHGQRKQGIPLQHLTENSRFLRQDDGRWLYVDGEEKYS